MPSSESGNVERVRRAFERWNGGDHSAPLDEVHPDAEVYTVIGGAFSGEPFRGHAGVREWLGGLDENFDRWQIDVGEIREVGDKVVVLGYIRARGRGSGVELDQSVGWNIRFRDDKFWRMETFFSHEEAVAAGGLS
jgi:ketosteroid isomerase-like protein